MNILLVTDDTSIISLVKHTLKKYLPGDKLFIARSGRDGIDYLNKSLNSQLDLIPSLIILDLDSVAANGLYFIQRVTTDLRIQNTQIAVLTSPLEQGDADHLDHLDLEYIIEKPLDHKTIHDLLQSLAVELEDAKPTEVERGVTPYRQPRLRTIDEADLRRVLVIETAASERKRLMQGVRRGETNSISLDFATSWIMAKRKVRKESYAVVILSADQSDVDKMVEVLAASRERMGTPAIVIVDPGNEDVGKAAVLAGANVYLVRDSGNYLSVLNELLVNMVERRRLEVLSRTTNDADKEMLREVIERAPLMMLRIDDSFAIIDCNETFAKASKHLRHSLIGRHVFDILPDLEVLPMISVLEDGVPYSRDGYRMKTIGHNHSATTYWDFHVWSIRRSISVRQEVILIAADISGRIELDQQRERFVAALAHDIRNPLVGGQRVLDSVLKSKHGELQPPQSKQLIASLQKSNQSLLLMLSNLIDVYKFETSAMTLQFRSVDLGGILREQIREIGHVAVSADVEIVEDIPDNLPPISGDINSIRRLVMNLLHNALKYCAPKTKIEIRAWKIANVVSFRIRNNGNPISADKMRTLFQSVADGVPIKHGSGLGLYLCRKIIQAHGATIECKSTTGGGTELLVRLKMLEDDLVSDDSQSAAG